MLLFSSPTLAHNCEYFLKIAPRFHVKQITSAACSLANGAMVLNQFLAKPITQTALLALLKEKNHLWPTQIKEGANGITLGEFKNYLKEMAEWLGVRIHTRVVYGDEFKTDAELKRFLKRPNQYVIINFDQGWFFDQIHAGHYVVLGKIAKDKAVVIDPDLDPLVPRTYTIPVSTLRKLTQGARGFLVVGLELSH